MSDIPTCLLLVIKKSNHLSHTSVKFNTVVLTWYDFTSYSIVISYFIFFSAI